jgi:hypothetical protein
MANFDEQPVIMACDGERMIGILTLPEATAGLPVAMFVLSSKSNRSWVRRSILWRHVFRRHAEWCSGDCAMPLLRLPCMHEAIRGWSGWCY